MAKLVTCLQPKAAPKPLGRAARRHFVPLYERIRKWAISKWTVSDIISIDNKDYLSGWLRSHCQPGPKHDPGVLEAHVCNESCGSQDRIVEFIQYVFEDLWHRKVRSQGSGLKRNEISRP